MGGFGNIGARGRLAAILVAGAVFFVWAGAANATPPPPCFGPQIIDPTGDGHHDPTDVVSAWFSEANDKLQVVIKVNAPQPKPDHDEPDVEAGLAFVFSVDGASPMAYVRARVFDDLSVSYDYGTVTLAGSAATFTSAGPDTTVGVVEPAGTGGQGTVTIDVPAATGAVEDAHLVPYVLTWDGFVGGSHVWVDHAPGGEHPPDTSRGAEYVVGSCGGAGIVSVPVTAPKRVKGTTKATITGKVLPEKAGVDVNITALTVPGKKQTATVKTAANGTFTAKITVKEKTLVTATAEGVTSQTATIEMRPIVKIKFRKLKNGKKRIVGTTNPALPGKLLLLRTTAFKATATKPKFKGGKFTFTFKKLKPGRFEVIYVPKKELRAERAVSNVARVR